MDINRVFGEAMALHRAGEVARAIEGYRAILAVSPDHHPSLNALGVAYLQAGRTDFAIRCIGEAIRRSPATAIYRANMSLAFDRHGYRAAARSFAAQAAALQARAPGPLSLDLLAARLAEHVPDVYFVQVGAMDGLSFDPIHALVRRHGWHGLLLEPLPDLFARLLANYAGTPGLRFENAAIAETEGTAEIRRIPLAAVQTGQAARGFAGMSSFRDNFAPGNRVLEDSGLGQEDLDRIRGLVTVETVRTMRLQTALARHGVEKIDVLQIDTEGFDYIVLKQLDFGLFRPWIVNMEIAHLSEEERRLATDLLVSQGYTVAANGHDLLATTLV